MSKHNETQNQNQDVVVEIVRPLGRVSARELSQEEIASIAGGFPTSGISNAGGVGDRDLMN